VLLCLTSYENIITCEYSLCSIHSVVVFNLTLKRSGYITVVI